MFQRSIACLIYLSCSIIPFTCSIYHFPVLFTCFTYLFSPSSAFLFLSPFPSFFPYSFPPLILYLLYLPALFICFITCSMTVASIADFLHLFCHHCYVFVVSNSLFVCIYNYLFAFAFFRFFLSSFTYFLFTLSVSYFLFVPSRFIYLFFVFFFFILYFFILYYSFYFVFSFFFCIFLFSF